MTNEQKLQELFKAALSAPDPTAAKPPRPVGPDVRPVVQSSEFRAAPFSPPAQAASVSSVAISVEAPAAVAVPNAGLDDESSAELGQLLDQRIERTKNQTRRNRLFSLAAVALAAGGAIYWVSSKPERLTLLKQSVADIKTVGDRDAVLASYDKSLEKIAARNDEFSDAAAALGVEPEKEEARPEVRPEAKPKPVAKVATKPATIFVRKVVPTESGAE